MTFVFDPRGVEEILKTVPTDAISSLARQVGDAAGPDAEVDTYTTDRAAAAVSVPAEQQAKDGVLTKAAAAAGLEVRAK